MKKITFLIFSLCILISCNVDAQCKVKTKLKKSYLRYAKSDDCDVEIDFATKPKSIFKKFSTGAAASFIKSGDEYFIYFYQVRSYSSRYEILENNSLVIIFEEGEPLALYPCGNFEGKKIGLLNYGIACFYKVTKEELENIADNIVHMVLIHISADHEISNTQIDEDGTAFFEYVIRSDNRADNAPTMASCILSK